MKKSTFTEEQIAFAYAAGVAHFSRVAWYRLSRAQSASPLRVREIAQATTIGPQQAHPRRLSARRRRTGPLRRDSEDIVRGKQAGMPYNNTYCWVYRLAGRKMQEVTEYMDTALVTAALGAPVLIVDR